MSEFYNNERKSELKMSKYKVGDKVRIVDKYGGGCNQNMRGKMDKWLGKVMTIKAIRYDCGYISSYRMEEDQEENYGYGWAWNDKCIAGLANKFNVGERYKVGKNVGSESGNIIEITEYENIRGWELYHYRTIYGRNPQTSPSFDLNSAFWRSLIPVTGDNEKIIIIRDGHNVTARKYVDEQLVNTAIAKCHPDDTFDFDIGARMAFERLMENVQHDEINEHQEKIKKGDFVVVVKHESDGLTMFHEIGDICVVESVRSDGNLIIRKGTSKQICNSVHIIKITPEKMRKAFGLE